MILRKESNYYIVESTLSDYERYLGVKPEICYLLVSFNTIDMFNTKLDLLRYQSKKLSIIISRYKKNVKGKRDAIYNLYLLDNKIKEESKLIKED